MRLELFSNLVPVHLIYFSEDASIPGFHVRMQPTVDVHGVALSEKAQEEGDGGEGEWEGCLHREGRKIVEERDEVERDGNGYG